MSIGHECNEAGVFLTTLVYIAGPEEPVKEKKIGQFFRNISRVRCTEAGRQMFRRLKPILTRFDPIVEPETVNRRIPFCQPNRFRPILTGFEPIVEPGTVTRRFSILPTESVQTDFDRI